MSTQNFQNGSEHRMGVLKRFVVQSTSTYVTGEKMTKHTHNHVETYDGLVGLGLDRETDEHTIIYYLQKFSDDTLIKELARRMTDQELDEIFSLLTRLLKKHLTDSEYHRLFLKDDHP
jgi:TorA maturation chaperone TorD